VAVNCGAIPENLIESELFGHKKGSFTGAVADKDGLFKVANGGTIFLDEIGELPLSMQVKLLRVLQEQEFERVGGVHTIKVDVRIITATNKNLEEEVKAGRFREDLYYRLNVVPIQLPALRERREDIEPLVKVFLGQFANKLKKPVSGISAEAMAALRAYSWPGNIRQLENEMERLIVLSGDEQRIGADLLSQQIRDFGESGKVQGVRVAGKLKDALEELEKTMIKEGLRRTNWNKSRLAKELGISRAGLIMKVEKYGLDKRKLMRNGTEAA
jgi:transcriptional regulator with PAS, ATPase and Fis domain